MRLVTTPTIFMASGYAVLFGLVAIPAFLGDAPRVRLVARSALSVPLVGKRALGPVARLASGKTLLRPVRQARMTTLTGLVPGKRLHPGQLRGMTGRAGAPIGRLANEIMRRVAALALDACVKLLVARGILVAGAAITHARAR